ncbi:hypothetical protein [Pedobacter sp. V48]|uniref:hypothetical protein n=1 Tax=Pedobacter sp. V48 TaxID=509635 RepID=UPI0003E52314|nr:hypothetical protein [Pedobacter sp. V48]ETZ19126.1 hypothetical protein N824_10310 [Pedobacter sp. V48]
MKVFDFDAIGTILLFAGLLIRFWIGRRRFKRKNFAGLNVFSSYLSSQVIPLFEWFLNLIGMLMIVYGVVAILL